MLNEQPLNAGEPPLGFPSTLSHQPSSPPILPPATDESPPRPLSPAPAPAPAPATPPAPPVIGFTSLALGEPESVPSKIVEWLREVYSGATGLLDIIDKVLQARPTACIASRPRCCSDEGRAARTCARMRFRSAPIG